jgi:hypothetical protein
MDRRTRPELAAKWFQNIGVPRDAPKAEKACTGSGRMFPPPKRAERIHQVRAIAASAAT